MTAYANNIEATIVDNFTNDRYDLGRPNIETYDHAIARCRFHTLPILLASHSLCQVFVIFAPHRSTERVSACFFSRRCRCRTLDQSMQTGPFQRGLGGRKSERSAAPW